MIKIKFWSLVDTMKSHRWFTILPEEAPTSNLSTLKNEAAGSAEMLETTHRNKWCHNSTQCYIINRLIEKKGTKHTHNFYFAYYQFSLQVILRISTLCILPIYFLHVH